MIKVTYTDFSRGIYDKEVKLKQSTFPAGERYIKIEEESLNELKADYCCKYNNIFVTVTALDATSNTIMDLMLLSSCITNNDKRIQKILNFSYLPYGRQDRVCSPGESDSLRVFMNMISPMYDKISILDAHNSRFDYPENVSLLQPFLSKYISVLTSERIGIFNKKCAIISVDRGSINRCKDTAEYFESGIIYFNKRRTEGKISHELDMDERDVSEIAQNVEYLVIIDDICDGGGTFLSIANKIKEIESLKNKKLVLIVTHGIFSAGLDKLKELFSHIFIYDSEYNHQRLALLSESYRL